MDFQRHFAQYFLLSLFIISILSGLGKGQEIPHDEEILAWDTPKDLQKKFPYFLSGYDDEGSPVWALELGKWDIRSAVEETGGVREDLSNYSKQAFERLASPHLYGQFKNVTMWSGIADMDGYDNRQLTSTLAVQQFFVGVRQFVGVLSKYQNNRKAIIVNSNFLFQTLWTLCKPYLGQYGDYTEVYGTNADKWKPILRKYFPKSALPEWLGGNADHKPLQIFG